MYLSLSWTRVCSASDFQVSLDHRVTPGEGGFRWPGEGGFGWPGGGGFVWPGEGGFGWLGYGFGLLLL